MGRVRIGVSSAHKPVPVTRPLQSRTIMNRKTISMNVNRVERKVEVEARTTLLDLVREEFGLTGAKLGCVGPTPVRANKAEALLIGKILNAELTREAGALASQECSPIGDLRGSEEYKRAIVNALVRRATDAAYKKALSQ